MKSWNSCNNSNYQGGAKQHHLLICIIIFIISLIVTPVNCNLFAQNNIITAQKDLPSLSAKLYNKVLGSNLISKIAETNSRQSLAKSTNSFIKVFLYFENTPNNSSKEKLQELGVNIFENTWTPKSFKHPLGFLVADIPANNFEQIIELNDLIKIGFAGDESFPQNNSVIKSVKADSAWGLGYRGSGVKIAILDSGLDADPINEDLPASIVVKDYSSYPYSLDDNVENHVTGHGTHVTGTVVSQGILSEQNAINGGGAYKGVAPEADLIFLKIGNDNNGSASTNAIVGALNDAVTIYKADIINLSYGSWDLYHDGSSSKDQKIDWCYDNGVPVFIAAGNEGDKARHFSSDVNANDSSEFIQLTMNADINTYLSFNMIWQDGTERTQFDLHYYDSDKNRITNLYSYAATESIRGTESEVSYCLDKVPEGNQTYYLRIINRSSFQRKVHLYEHYRNGRVKFKSPDPNYTMISPATADHGFAVGAFVSRSQWESSDGQTNNYSHLQNEIAPFSSRGPRIDGLMKPDLVTPGTAIISLKDRDVLTAQNPFWIDNDGNTGGDANYYVMEGTSMAAPVALGAAALFLEKTPDASPQTVYDVLKQFALRDETTGTAPNSTYGFGKLDIYNVLKKYPIEDDPLPVELKSFTLNKIGETIYINFNTITETNNYGFEIERKLIYNNEQNSDWEMLGFIPGAGNSNIERKYSFDDSFISDAINTLYRIKQIDNDGTYYYSETLSLNNNLINTYELFQNYPNPFNPVTTIKYYIPQITNVKLTVFNLLGEIVTTLVNEQKEIGYHQFQFNPKNISSGVYFYRLETTEFTSTKKMIFLK